MQSKIDEDQKQRCREDNLTQVKFKFILPGHSVCSHNLQFTLTSPCAAFIPISLFTFT